MSNYSQRVRIQNHLRSLAMNGTFFVVTYVAGQAQDIDFTSDQAKKAVPKTAVANETQETYVADRNMGRRLQLQRDQWLFDLVLVFDTEVTLECFIQNLLDNPPILDRDEEKSLDPAIIRLVRTNVTHPPQQQASNGTHAILTFAVTTGRH